MPNADYLANFDIRVWDFRAWSWESNRKNSDFSEINVSFYEQNLDITLFNISNSFLKGVKYNFHSNVEHISFLICIIP